MSNGSNFTFNNDISGGNNQINQGQHVEATQNVGASMPTVDAVFDAVQQSLDESNLPSEDRVQIQSEVIDPLREIAKQPAEQQQEPTTMEKAKELIGRLSPFAPAVSKAVLAFGEASLTALASRNPVVSGLLAAVKATRQAAPPQ